MVQENRRTRVAVVAIAALLLSMLGAGAAPAQEQQESASALLITEQPGAEPIGAVTFEEFEGVVLVTARVEGLEPGFHGFHVHAGDSCTDETTGLPDFSQAGGHLGHDPDNPETTPHGTHAGDMPVLYVDEAGNAFTSFPTDRFSVEDVVGRTIIVHAAPDNYANIPDRYVLVDDPDHTGPDEATLATGDAGGRVACGEIEEGIAEEAQIEELVFGEAERFVPLIGPAGQVVGTASFHEVEGGLVHVSGFVDGLEPGFHGFHIHAGPRCTDDAGVPDFLAAAGHFNPDDAAHGDHAGDMPVLYVTEEGWGNNTFTTDRFTIDDLAGRAVMVHALPDNYANIDERYRSTEEDAPESGPDQATLATGDAGGRVACGAVDGEAVRLAGSGRIQTAVALSQASFPEGAQAAVIARADVFADGLAGTPLAADRAGPMLLTPSNELHADTAAELQRALPPGATVYLLGGQSALSAEVEAAVAQLGFLPQRLAGPTRIQTAIAIADELGDPGTLLITTGYRFPDALTAGAAAGVSGGAVLLTISEQRHPDVDAYLEERGDAKVFAVGGPAARPYDEAEPVFGRDRIETALEVADTFFEQPFVVGLARQGGAGTDDDPTFADALTGGAHASHLGSPVLLTPSNELDDRVAAWIAERQEAVRLAYLYGGPSALSAEVLAQTRAALSPGGNG